MICPSRAFLAYSSCGCCVLLLFLHFLVSEEFSSHWEIGQVTRWGGTTDLQGHHLHGQSGAGSGYVLGGHHDTYHTYAVRLLETSRGPAFPTGLPLCCGKAQKQGSFVTDFNWFIAKHMCKCFAELFFCENCLLTWAYRVLILLCNNLREDLQRMLHSLQTLCLHPSESENSGRENPWDGNLVICAGTRSKPAAALPAGCRQCLGASVGCSQWPDRRQPHGFGREEQPVA